MQYSNEVIQTVLNQKAQEILFSDFNISKSCIDNYGIHDYSIGGYLMSDKPYEYYNYYFAFDFLNLTFETQDKIIDAFENVIYEKFNSVQYDLDIDRSCLYSKEYRDVFPEPIENKIVRVVVNIRFTKYL